MRAAKDTGFTLIEVLVAMGVLVIGMTGILALYTASVAIQKEATERSDVAVHVSGVMAAIEDALDRASEQGEDRRGALEALSGRTIPVPNDARYRYQLTVVPDPSDDGGTIFLCRVVLLARRKGRDQVHDFGYFPIVPERGNDRRIRELLGR